LTKSGDDTDRCSAAKSSYNFLISQKQKRGSIHPPTSTTHQAIHIKLHNFSKKMMNVKIAQLLLLAMVLQAVMAVASSTNNKEDSATFLRGGVDAAGDEHHEHRELVLRDIADFIDSIFRAIRNFFFGIFD
jgi:hypothetical protein